jgi:hypothetical protein
MIFGISLGQSVTNSCYENDQTSFITPGGIGCGNAAPDLPVNFHASNKRGSRL